jgi:hypothetical protein
VFDVLWTVANATDGRSFYLSKMADSTSSSSSSSQVSGYRTKTSPSGAPNLLCFLVLHRPPPCITFTSSTWRSLYTQAANTPASPRHTDQQSCRAAAAWRHQPYSARRAADSPACPARRPPEAHAPTRPRASPDRMVGSGASGW